MKNGYQILTLEISLLKKKDGWITQREKKFSQKVTIDQEMMFTIRELSLLPKTSRVSEVKEIITKDLCPTETTIVVETIKEIKEVVDENLIN